jgi:hypothetical protein
MRVTVTGLRLHCAEVQDKIRQEYIESFGIQFLRFTNEDVYKNIDGVYQTVYNKIEEIKIVEGGSTGTPCDEVKSDDNVGRLRGNDSSCDRILFYNYCTIFVNIIIPSKHLTHRKSYHTIAFLLRFYIQGTNLVDEMLPQ